MVKLLVKKAFLREGNILVEKGDTIEVSEEVAKEIEKIVPDRVERVKDKPIKTSPKRQAKKPKNEDDE